MLDVKSLSKTYRRLLDNLNIKVKSFNISCSGDSNYVISFDTDHGSYEIPCAVTKLRASANLEIQNFILFEQLTINGFIHDTIMAVILNMANAKDDAVVFFFEGLCIFWDEVFMRAYGAIDGNIKFALTRFDISMRDITGLYKSYYNQPIVFRWFITGTLGNLIYYNGGLGNRKEINVHNRGGIF